MRIGSASSSGPWGDRLSGRFPADSFPSSHISSLYRGLAISCALVGFPHDAGCSTALAYMLLTCNDSCGNDHTIRRTPDGLSVHGAFALGFCRAFQRFAVRTNRTLEDLSSKAKQAREEISEQFKDARGPNDRFKQ
uniref:Uncharacterized protein n=1 Tax=Triticum urartu TaxID=4572 RepID=A0A8R7PGV0_TRIUA